MCPLACGSQRTLQAEVVLDERDPYFATDCTIVNVPSECAGYVTGANGSFLRLVEQEYGTGTFFKRPVLLSNSRMHLKLKEKLASNTCSASDPLGKKKDV